MHSNADSPAALVAGVLDEEQRRHDSASSSGRATVLPDDELPSVDVEALSLREGLRQGGKSLLLVIGLLAMLETLETSAFAVIVPEIQNSLDVSDGAIGAIAGAFGILFLLGSIPVSSLADRMPRKFIVGVAVSLWSVVVAVTSSVQNAFQLFMGRMGAGLGQSYHLPVAGPLLMDGYPIGARGKVFAVNCSFQMAGQALGPLVAGGIVAVVDGDNAWRWVMLSIAAAGVPLAIAAFFLREPRRGGHEMKSVLGAELHETVDELPISLSVAFERLKKIRTFHFVLTGMAALGFALFSTAIFINIYLEDHFGLTAFERGAFGSLTILPGFAGAAWAGARTDRLFRESPPKAMVFIGSLVGAFGVLQVVGLWMPNVWSFGIMLGISAAFSRAAFAILPGVMSTVIPYRLRSRGTAMMGIYLFVFGAFLGAILTGLLSDSIGERGALTTIILPATIIGGGLMTYGARFIRSDIAMVVEELREENAEQARIEQPGSETPVLQVRNLDFSYGKVQVLFDVGFEVRKGESLALLGTNGAGKSTVLRVISGLGVPQRGVVRLNGRTVTYTDPELRAKLGIVQLAGGKAVFPHLTIDQNLRMAGYRYSRQECHERIEKVVQMFPSIQFRRDSKAGELSGGQQQMVALAMALLHDPEVLILDELSLGLAPVVVQELIAVVERLRSEGLTMIIVEQSLNVALAISDRAIFLEKGQVRFEGSARDLAERDDLARAVFLGQTGAPT